jgi:hypothetical protein
MPQPINQAPEEPDHGRVPLSRAPHLYEALGWAGASAVCLAGAILIMSRINLAIGLAVLIIFQVAIFLGGRAVIKHHRAEDERRERARAEYADKLANLLGSTQATGTGSRTIADAEQARPADEL